MTRPPLSVFTPVRVLLSRVPHPIQSTHGSIVGSPMRTLVAAGRSNRHAVGTKGRRLRAGLSFMLSPLPWPFRALWQPRQAVAHYRGIRCGFDFKLSPVSHEFSFTVLGRLSYRNRHALPCCFLARILGPRQGSARC